MDLFAWIINWILPIPGMAVLAALSASVLCYKFWKKRSLLLIIPLVGRLYLLFLYAGIMDREILSQDQTDLLLRLGIAVVLMSDLISFFFWQLPFLISRLARMNQAGKFQSKPPGT